MVHTLLEAQRNLDDIYAINWGGCGISALAMYRWLKDNDMLVGDESFTYLYIPSDSSYENNTSVLEERNNNRDCNGKLASASHIMLYHNGQHLDSRGDRIGYQYSMSHTGMSEEQLLESLNHGFWNDSFNRSLNVPKIEKMLKIKLSDIKFW